MRCTIPFAGENRTGTPVPPCAPSTGPVIRQLPFAETGASDARSAEPELPETLPACTPFPGSGKGASGGGFRSLGSGRSHRTFDGLRPSRGKARRSSTVGFTSQAVSNSFHVHPCVTVSRRVPLAVPAGTGHGSRTGIPSHPSSFRSRRLFRESGSSLVGPDTPGGARGRLERTAPSAKRLPKRSGRHHFIPDTTRPEGRCASSVCRSSLPDPRSGSAVPIPEALPPSIFPTTPATRIESAVPVPERPAHLGRPNVGSCSRSAVRAGGRQGSSARPVAMSGSSFHQGRGCARDHVTAAVGPERHRLSLSRPAPGHVTHRPPCQASERHAHHDKRRTSDTACRHPHRGFGQWYRRLGLAR